ncbi:hypothetical protein ABPG72_018536 [Tetrahymena utriculariae]
MLLKLISFCFFVCLYAQQFDCVKTLQQAKPSTSLGYSCMIASKTDFTYDLIQKNQWKYYESKNKQPQTTVFSGGRYPQCPNIINIRYTDLVIDFDISAQNQYLDSIYTSFALVMAKYYQLIVTGFWAADFQDTSDGCSQLLSTFFVNIPVSNVAPTAVAASIKFEFYNQLNGLGAFGFTDYEVLFYFQCPVGCTGACPSGKCQSCASGYDLVSGQCQMQCPPNQSAIIDPKSSQQSCITCISNCDKCSDVNSCDTCKDGFVYMKISNIYQCITKCIQPSQYIDSQGVCQNCIQNCTTCSQADTCDTCTPPYIKTQSNTCQCSGYFSGNQCLPCYSSCLTCSDGQSKSCQSCQNGYYPVLNTLSQTQFECLQVCPNNFLLTNNQCQQCDQTNYKNCFNCPSSCRSCSSPQSTTCIDCFDGMQLNPNGKCSSLTDQRDINFYLRSNNNIAVVNAVFSGSTPTLTFEFGLNLISSAVSCDQIFDSSTLDLLKSSTCSINTSKVIVTLSQDANAMVTDTIKIINTAQKLQFQAAPQPINNIYLVSVVQEPVSGDVILQYDQIVDYCSDIIFKIQTIKNDLGRGFKTFQWALDQTQNYDQSTINNFNTIIQTANNKQDQTLIITKQTFPPNINIAIKLIYTLKANFSGSSSATTFCQSVKQISVKAIQNFYASLYRYVDLQVKFMFFTQESGISGSSAVQDIYDVQIKSQMLPSLNQHFTEYKSQVLPLNIPPYSILSANTNLDIQLQMFIITNKALSTTFNLSIPYSLSNLQIFIQNGVEQLVDYKRNFILQGVARDFEVSDPNSPQGIKLSWSCKVIASRNGDNQCYTYKNTLFNVPQNILSFTIEGGTFNPYQILQFNFAGSKDTRSAKQDILIIFAEIDLPPLYVKFDDPSQIQQVNINDDISATLLYDSKINSDILTYAGAILYNNFVVGVIKFDYQKVKFRIWDYFSNLVATNPLVQVRFTVYNPENIMPSLSVTNFKVNIPPQNCKLSITPSSGQALTTKFDISLTRCTTNNNPLTYQFFYYNHDTDVKQEILVPQKILRRQLQDQTRINSVTTYLPSGKLVIMVQAMDSYLAIYNTTLQVDVTPFQQDEQALLNLLDQTLTLQNSNLGVSDIVKNLCVVSEEISQNTHLYNLDSVNQEKIRLMQAIINQTNLLPSSSFLSTFSNKIVATLQASLASTQSLESQNVLDQVSLILQNQEKQIKNNNNNNKLLNNNDIVLQNLVDSFKIVNSTTQSISQILEQLSKNNGNRILTSINSSNQDQISTNSLRNLASSLPQNVLQQQINMADQIGNLLNNITLPNQGQLSLQGNLISIKTEQITAKNLQRYLYVQNEPQQNDPNIYNVVLTNYSSNPFVQTDGFLQYTNQFKHKTPDVQVSLNPVVKPFIQSLNNGSNTSFDNSFQLQFSNIKPSNYNLTCLQQQSSQKWLNSQCKMLNSSISGRFTCNCKDQRPTTIIEDFQTILNNKNLETAFGSQGIQNISNFTTFYEYAIFWILSSVTLLQVGLCWYGKQLDSKQVVLSCSTIAPASLAHIGQLEQIVSQEKQMSPIKRRKRSLLQKQKQLQPDQQQDQYQQNDQNGQSYRWLKSNMAQTGVQSNIQVTQLSNKQSQDTQLQKNKIQQQDQENVNENQSILSLCINQKEEKDFQQINQRVKIDQKSQDGKTRSIEIQGQQQNEEEKKMINILKESQNSKKLQESSILKKILIFHSFSSIFYIYSNEQSRAFRFSLFYLRVIHSLSISIIFDQQYNQEQILIISGINSVIIIVSATIIQLLYKKGKIGKSIACLIMIGLLALYYYIILSIVSGQSESYSNRKISSFFIMFGVDFLFFSTIISIFSIFIFSYIASGGNSNGILLRLLNLLQIQYILENLKL